MVERHPTAPQSPEEMLDRWLDALNEPDRISFPVPSAEIWDIADIALRYRHTFGTAPATTVARAAIAERNGSMNHALPLSKSNGDAWRAVRPARHREPGRKSGWVTWLSNSLATAMVIALLVALGGAMIVQQGGLPGGSSDPTRQPGVAVSPQATPEGGMLSCASPGYRAVVEGDVDEDTLAMIGVTEEPVVISEDEVVVPQANGESFPLSEGAEVVFDPGVMTMWHENGSATITRLSDGQSWTFPAVEGEYETRARIIGNGRFYVGSANPEQTNWTILDITTGEQTTTEAVLGEPFNTPPEYGVVEWAASTDGSVLVIDFSEFAVGEETQQLPASYTYPGVLVIPGSLSNAYFKTVLSPYTWVSPNGGYLASFNQIIDVETGETFVGLVGDEFLGYLDGMFIAFLDEEPTILSYVIDEVRMVQPATGTNELVFQAGGEIQALGYDTEANAIVVGAGEPGTEEWTWVDLGTGASMPLPGLAGYRLNFTSPVEPVRYVTGPADLVQFQESDSYRMRALNMANGRISDAVTMQFPAGSDHITYFPDVANYPTIVHGGVVAAQDRAGNFTVLDPATGTQFEIPKLANVDLSSSPYLSLSGTPSEQCLMLDIYDEGFNPTGTTYVAPIEPGATWTELDVRIRQWVEFPDGTETLPAQEIASPVATPIN